MKIPWVISIQTEHVIEHRQPDIVVVDKDNKRALLMDIAVPADARVEEKAWKRKRWIDIKTWLGS